ncbi:MAG: AraC family transcriptional regulator [Ardenticatenaceae bacterium]|nr:AraC family transcriptional regulator [Anaerolineales bacterium]MCB8922411.1 AraC family transcriptional regulator [Ardenticatenaceae bacterium]MCB8991343.1 AraC family transcriptional regulator [Ardenticatenaceae bacterium]
MNDQTNASEPFSVSTNVLSQMFLYLTSLNVDVDGFLRSLGVDPASVKKTDAYLPVQTYLRIQDEAAHRTNDPYFGLHMGEFAEAGSWFILGYMMMNCQTLGEAFEKSGRYSRIVGNMIEAKAELRFNKIKVVFFTPPGVPPMSRHCYESTFSSSVRMMRSLTGTDIHPLEVTFTYPEPPDTAEYERIFNCPVRFGQKENRMLLDWGIVNTPILLPNPELLRYFENYAQEFLADMDRQNEHTRTVTRIILNRLDDESLSIETVADEMAVSVRTLQNYLKDEGVVFSDLLKDIRERLAKKYLRENYSVADITYLLGFSEPSVFRKAFKRWSGVTPGQYRTGSFTAVPHSMIS